jgi:hypothetical protein
MRYKLKRAFCRLALAVFIVSLLFNISGLSAFAETAGPLPEPIVTGNSVELCLNSRYSEHDLSGTASEQQLSNVLWAARMAPVIGTYRDIYVATPNATYLYDPSDHSLSWHSDEVADENAAFAISYDRDLAFDAGVSYMPALLASVSLWSGTESQVSVSNCPKQTKLYFGVQEVRGLTSEVVAHSSVPEGEPGWLPDPATIGDNSLEAVLSNLNYFSNFAQTNLTLQQISQILWAGYGCTPHVTTLSDRKGLTVPSAYADYYLTGTIYLVSENGVYRYHNRLPPGTDLTTRDHRIEQVSSTDVRNSLQSVASGLPQAPCYIILCLDYGYIEEKAHEHRLSVATVENYARLETGFVASNMLIQASAIGLGSHFRTELSSGEQESIQNATSIPSSHIPQVVVSIGPPVVSPSISITTDGTIAFGVMALGAIQDTTPTGLNDVQTVTVESGPVDLYIRTSLFSDSTTSWSLGTINGPDQVIWEFSRDGADWVVFEVADALYLLASGLAEDATQDIYFRLTMPTSTSSSNEFSATVTITAASP